ncbi:hypothetical protein [Pseudomonas sp. MWU13-2100]|nr:hypothetical protein [Pseudomonas sp. MWU13-2100]
MGREEEGSGHWPRLESLGIHLFGPGVGAGPILGVTLLTGLRMVNFH